MTDSVETALDLPQSLLLGEGDHELPVFVSGVSSSFQLTKDPLGPRLVLGVPGVFGDGSDPIAGLSGRHGTIVVIKVLKIWWGKVKNVSVFIRIGHV